MKILIADDHQMMRDGLKAILGREGLEVIGDATNGRDAVSLAHTLLPDLVIMDVGMPEMNGVEATRRLTVELPQVKVLGLSMSSEKRLVLAMFAAGAVGCLVKSSAAEELVQAIRAIASGHKYVSPAIADLVLGNLTLPEQAAGTDGGKPGTVIVTKPLTAREREVLQLLAEGKSSKQIADLLSVAVPTVETHRRQIMDKLGRRSIAELTKYAIREGLTALD